MPALCELCEQGQKKVSAEGKRKREGEGERTGKPRVIFRKKPSLPVWFLPVFLFCSLLFCCSKLTGTGFTGGTASYLIWLSFSPFPHFCLCVVPIHPRSILGGNFCVNYKESRGERSDIPFSLFLPITLCTWAAFILITPFLPLLLVR